MNKDNESSSPLDVKIYWIQTVYKQCHYLVACRIILIHVDNNGARTNCLELLEKFERDIAEHRQYLTHSIWYICLSLVHVFPPADASW